MDSNKDVLDELDSLLESEEETTQKATPEPELIPVGQPTPAGKQAARKLVKGFQGIISLFRPGFRFDESVIDASETELGPFLEECGAAGSKVLRQSEYDNAIKAGAYVGSLVMATVLQCSDQPPQSQPESEPGQQVAVPDSGEKSAGFSTI